MMGEGKRQQGAGLITMLLVIAMTGMVVLGGLKLVPVFYDFYVIKNELQAVQELANDKKLGRREIWQAFSKRMQINNIDYLTEDDLLIDRGDGTIKLGIDYEARPSFLGNVGFVVKFDSGMQKE